MELQLALIALLSSGLLGAAKWLMPQIKERTPRLMFPLVIMGINYLGQSFGKYIPGLPELSGSPDTWDATTWTVIAGGMVSMGSREILNQINKYLKEKGFNIGK